MRWMVFVFAVGAGVLNAVQSGANATLNKSLGQPVAAGLVITVVGACGILASSLYLGLSVREAVARVPEVPWWAWLGGLCGATYVLSTLLVAQEVGAAVFMGLTVTAAILTSLALDHFGLLGFEEHPLGWGRGIGAVLMLAGLALLAWF